MTVRLPSRGQPVDITYLLDIANGVNDALEKVSNIGSNSTIKPTDAAVEPTPTPKLRFYASKKSVSVTAGTSNVVVSFNDLGFSQTPIVTASFLTADTNSQTCYAVVTYVDSNVCRAQLVVPAGTTGNITGEISIIAIGKTSTS